MPITQLGAINTTALIVPDVYVQIVPPRVLLLNGVPSNVIGFVGVASWGPVNSPIIAASMTDYFDSFGPILPHKHDLGTIMAAAVGQGANNFRLVRVTDGGEVSAEADIVDNASAIQLTVTAKYPGTRGNLIKVTTSQGSAVNSWKVTVAMPGIITEAFDNIHGTANDIWIAMANAINQGQSGIRGPSELITAVAGVSTETPSPNETTSLTGGLDGNTAVNSDNLLGNEVGERTGMYALRNTGISVFALANADDSGTWSEQVSFALSEGAYGILTGPQSETVDDAIMAKGTAGIDSFAVKMMLGDWCIYNDTVNGGTRLISSQGYIAGRLGNLAPQESSLNKPLFALVGTEKSRNNQQYSHAELQALAQAGIDVVTTPSPGGNYFAARIGHNSSSNPVINGDNYTRMTNYITKTFEAGMGIYIGRLHSATERKSAKATLETFLSNMEQQGQIGNAEGTTPFLVTLDKTNNPQSRVALGYIQADVQVQYLSVIEKFIINVEGGQSVQITRIETVPVT